MQPRPLPQHLGRERRGLFFISYTHNTNYTRPMRGGRAGRVRVCTYLHAALGFLDGVVQQTLEATLKGPALLHKRLIAADTPRESHADVTHGFDKLSGCVF